MESKKFTLPQEEIAEFCKRWSILALMTNGT
jgi:hypothetical protein